MLEKAFRSKRSRSTKMILSIIVRADVAERFSCDYIEASMTERRLTLWLQLR